MFKFFVDISKQGHLTVLMSNIMCLSRKFINIAKAVKETKYKIHSAERSFQPGSLTVMTHNTYIFKINSKYTGKKLSSKSYFFRMSMLERIYTQDFFFLSDVLETDLV